MSNAMLDWAEGGAPVRDRHVDRREERTDANLMASIRLADGDAFRCVVKDVSKSGAKLGLPRGRVLPETFMIKVNGRDLVFQVRLAWQRDCYAGVSIERIARLSPTAGSS